ncbi:MAG: TraX family protein [Lachnospiraceae bacterium]
MTDFTQNNTSNSIEYAPKKAGIPGSTLKLIAIFTMLIDHIAASFLNGYLTLYAASESPDPSVLNQLYLLYTIMRLIGRIAFPIFCFLLVEGFIHTRNPYKYGIRLFLFALISEFPFDLAFSGELFDWSHQNVYFTLFLGLAAIYAMQYIEKKLSLSHMASAVSNIGVLIPFMLLAGVMKTDYSAFGVMTIAVIYFLRSQKVIAMITANICLTVMSLFEISGFLSVIAVKFYNGERGLSLKYVFYLFYPVHLFLLYLLCVAAGIYSFPFTV